MKTPLYVIALAASLLPAMASANVYEIQVKQALENIAQRASGQHMGLTYKTHTDPNTGNKDGELRILTFELDGSDAYLIDEAVRIYQDLSTTVKRGGDVPDLYTLQCNTRDDDKLYTGHSLYYGPENTIIVGAGADNCCTVGFLLPDNADYRNTYTLEWSQADDDNVKGRVINTLAPVPSRARNLAISSGNWPLDDDSFPFETVALNQGMEKLRVGLERLDENMDRLGSTSTIVVTSSSGEQSSSRWMKKMLFYLDKIQHDLDSDSARYIYLSKLYDLCKNTDDLDRQDLKIALQQVTTCYNQLKPKKILTENELLFLHDMAELLKSKTQ